MTKKNLENLRMTKPNVSTRSCRYEKTLPAILKIFKGCLQGLFLERGRHNVSSKIFDVKFDIAVYVSIGILIVINNSINTYGQKCTSNGSPALESHNTRDVITYKKCQKPICKRDSLQRFTKSLKH